MLPDGRRPGRRPVSVAAAAAALAAAYSFQDPLWDDGYAEVATYQASRVIYGQPRAHSAAAVVVKEDMDPAQHVKWDNPGPGALSVLKLNVAAVAQTDNYPYDFFLTVFVRRDDPRKVVKLVTNTHEHCGTTFHMLKGWTDPAGLSWNSYFDGEGDGTALVPLPAGTLLEDQLPVALRALPFQAGYTEQDSIVRTFVGNRHRPIVTTPATISVVSKDGADGWKVTVRGDKLAQTYWFAAVPPHVLRKFESDDGRALTIQGEALRTKYWERPAKVKGMP